MRTMLPGYLNPERPRCAWCDRPFRNRADLIAHQAEHRGSAEEMAARLHAEAAKGLENEETTR